MRIIFIFNLDVINIQFYDFINLLGNENQEVVVYDLLNSKRYYPTSNKTLLFNPFLGSKWLLKIKYLRHLIRPFINKMIIRKEFEKNDVVNIHYLFPYYAGFMHLIKSKVKYIHITFWGSDILRAKDSVLARYVPLFEMCTSIAVPDEMQKNLLKTYKGFNQRYSTLHNFEQKLKTIYFGLSVLDEIINVKEIDIINFKQKYQLPFEERIYVTLAHNGSPAQQHLLLIDMLSNLDKLLKNKIFVLVPMTYGAEESYKKTIEDSLKAAKVDYKIFVEYFQKNELASSRLISDINLNIQITDGFSGSISEFLFADNIVLVGDWLPYGIYEDWGVKIYRISMDDYARKLVDIIVKYDYYLQEISANREIIYDNLSWNVMLPKWIDLYNNK